MREPIFRSEVTKEKVSRWKPVNYVTSDCYWVLARSLKPLACHTSAWCVSDRLRDENFLSNIHETKFQSLKEKSVSSIKISSDFAVFGKIFIAYFWETFEIDEYILGTEFSLLNVKVTHSLNCNLNQRHSLWSPTIFRIKK